MPIDKPSQEIPGFPGYQVRADGSIWHGEKRLRTFVNGNVLKVNLSSKGRGKAVSHLVLTAFVAPRPAGACACHFPDRDPKNCAVENLRWGTDQDNADDRKKHGTLPLGERGGRCRLSDETVEAIRGASGRNSVIARRFGITPTHVSNLKRTTGARRAPIRSRHVADS